MHRAPAPQHQKGQPFNNFEFREKLYTQICALNWSILTLSPLSKFGDQFIMMFNAENVLRAPDQGKPHVSICLLPTTSAVMDSNLTRNERWNYLSQAWAFFWCYKQTYTNSLPRSLPVQCPSKRRGTNQRMAIYDKITCDKAISLCYALSRIIADSRTVHLGALGTHWLEHFFGNVRRLCNRNDCPANFERSIYLIIMTKALNGLAAPKEANRNRCSDSGAILPQDTQENCLPTCLSFHIFLRHMQSYNFSRTISRNHSLRS